MKTPQSKAAAANTRARGSKYNIFGLCLDWRVLIALVAIAGALFLAKPSLLVVAWPFLLYALCPLSMLLMMKMMGGNNAAAQGMSGTPPQSPSLRDDQQIPQLRLQLQNLHDQEEMLRRRIALGERPDSAPSTAVAATERRRGAPAS